MKSATFKDEEIELLHSLLSELKSEGKIGVAYSIGVILDASFERVKNGSIETTTNQTPA